MNKRTFLKSLFWGTAGVSSGLSSGLSSFRPKLPLVPVDKIKGLRILPADDPKKLRLGWTIYEEVGICVINDSAIQKTEIVMG